MKPRALDLYCGAGSVGRGLIQAGFEVTGVDVEDQPDYPGHFVLMDALLLQPYQLEQFALVWASPPCQPYSFLRAFRRTRPPTDTIERLRALLASHPVTCIENVLSAPIRSDLILRWEMFRPDAPFPRVRKFELSWPMLAPPPAYKIRGSCLVEAYGNGATNRRISAARREAGLPPTTRVEELEAAFGFTTTGLVQKRRRNLNAAIPPVYAEYIGRAALAMANRFDLRCTA